MTFDSARLFSPCIFHVITDILNAFSKAISKVVAELTPGSSWLWSIRCFFIHYLRLEFQSIYSLLLPHTAHSLLLILFSCSFLLLSAPPPCSYPSALSILLWVTCILLSFTSPFLKKKFCLYGSISSFMSLSIPSAEITLLIWLVVLLDMLYLYILGWSGTQICMEIMSIVLHPPFNFWNNMFDKLH